MLQRNSNDIEGFMQMHNLINIKFITRLVNA